jgi:hypothetical protein
MRTNRRAVLFAIEIFAKFAAVGAVFTAAVYFLKHPYFDVLLVIFLVPVAIGTILAAAILFPSLLPGVRPSARVQNAKPPPDA